MRRATLVLDGLWFCLCPSFNSPSLNCPGTFLLKGKRAPKIRNSSTKLRSVSVAPRRYYSDQRHEDEQRTTLETAADHSTVPAETSGECETLSGVNKWGTIPRRKIYPVPEAFQKKSNATLERSLQDRMKANSLSIQFVTQILSALIRDRHVCPEVRHYRALILANSDAERGSPNAVRELLLEMDREGFPVDSGTLHAALQALAVHPDYLLRQEIIRTLRDRWLPLSPAGWHYVVAGYIREHQFELALEQVALMERKGIPIESWLHSLLVYNLCDVEEFDEVLKLMQSRANQTNDITLDLWMYVLDAASEALHHQTTRYVWNHMVEFDHLYPSYGVCSNVLTLASRVGDTKLAAAVLRFLDRNEVPIFLEDREKTAETHIVAGDVSAAFEVLCSTHMSGVALERSSTRSILTYLIRSQAKPTYVWSILKQLKSRQLSIPKCCANVVFELCEHDALFDASVVDDAIRIYKELCFVCPDGADTLTYTYLINMCRRAQNTKAGMFFIKEMATLGCVPEAKTFEHIIIMCLNAENFRSAYMYFKDMVERGYRLSDDALVEVRGLCSLSTDTFARLILTHPLVKGNVIRWQGPVAAPSEDSTSTEESKPVVRKLITDKPEEVVITYDNLGRRGLKKQLRREETKVKRKARRKRAALARLKVELGLSLVRRLRVKTRDEYGGNKRNNGHGGSTSTDMSETNETSKEPR